jgi:hypothetical protein
MIFPNIRRTTMDTTSLLDVDASDAYINRGSKPKTAEFQNFNINR